MNLGVHSILNYILNRMNKNYSWEQQQEVKKNVFLVNHVQMINNVMMKNVNVGIVLNLNLLGSTNVSLNAKNQNIKSKRMANGYVKNVDKTNLGMMQLVNVSLVLLNAKDVMVLLKPALNVKKAKYGVITNVLIKIN